MDLQGMTDKFERGIKAWLVLIAATIAWLFGGSFKETFAAGREWIWPQSEAELAEAETARVEDETERLLTSLDRDEDPDWLVARRFLNGEMTADITKLGTSVAGRIISIRVQGLDHASWSDKKLRQVTNGQRNDVFDKPLRVHDDGWTQVPSLAM